MNLLLIGRRESEFLWPICLMENGRKIMVYNVKTYTAWQNHNFLMGVPIFKQSSTRKKGKFLPCS